MRRHSQPFRQTPVIGPRLRTGLQPVQIPLDGVPPLLQLPGFFSVGLPGSPPTSKTLSQPLSPPSTDAAAGNSQTWPGVALAKTAHSRTSRNPARSRSDKPRNSARSFLQHQRVLIALMRNPIGGRETGVNAKGVHMNFFPTVDPVAPSKPRLCPLISARSCRSRPLGEDPPDMRTFVPEIPCQIKEC